MKKMVVSLVAVWVGLNLIHSKMVASECQRVLEQKLVAHQQQIASDLVKYQVLQGTLQKAYSKPEQLRILQMVLQRVEREQKSFAETREMLRFYLELQQHIEQGNHVVTIQLQQEIQNLRKQIRDLEKSIEQVDVIAVAQ